METVTIKIKKEYANRVLEDLKALDAIDFVEENFTRSKKRVFKAISISTKTFKFNRDEANER